MESLKILITGVTGFIGSNVAGHLVNDNHEIYGMSRNESYNWRLEDQRDIIRMVSSDISSYERTLSAVEKIKPDGIINCAQYGAYPTEKSNKTVFETNIGGLFNILDVSNKFHVNWLINCGTSFEYGASKESVAESMPSNPSSAYGITKATGSNMINLYSKILNTKLMNLRIFQAYGPFEPKGRLVPYLLYNLINNQDIHLNNPYLERDFVYIKDIVGAFSNAIRVIDNLETHETINIGTGKYTSIHDFANLGKKVMDSSSHISVGSSASKPEDRVDRIYADITKALKLLKWFPKYQVKDGINDFSFWMKNKLDYYRE